MKKLIERNIVLSIILTITLCCGSFAAIISYMDDPTTLVSKGEVMEWSSMFAETLRTIDYSVVARVQATMAQVLVTRKKETEESSGG